MTRILTGYMSTCQRPADSFAFPSQSVKRQSHRTAQKQAYL
jgi:hypothetical protein